MSITVIALEDTFTIYNSWRSYNSFVKPVELIGLDIIEQLVESV